MATFALIAWFPFTVYFFYARRERRSVARTTAWALLAGLMILPQYQLTIPVLPLTKMRVIYLSVLLSLGLFHRDLWRARATQRGFELGFVALFASHVVTVATNLDPLPFLKVTVPAYKPIEMIYKIVIGAADFYLPFLIGYRVFRTRQELRQLLSVLALSGLVYAFPTLLEIRLSPQIHGWVYGFIGYSWLQALREGGFRPAVMMAHGLGLAMFLFSVIAATAGLYKARLKVWRLPAGAVLLFLTVVLFLCKSKGALIFALLALALLLSGRRSLQRWVAVALVSTVISYPLLRYYGVFPADDVVELAERLSEERAASLGFRFHHEALMLERAVERPVFGWGDYSRYRVHDDEGRDISVADGAWIIVLGKRGAVGFVLYFGLVFCLPVFSAARRLKRARGPDAHLLAALTLIVAIYCADQIPNSLFDSLPIVWAGALLSLARHWPASTSTAPPPA